MKPRLVLAVMLASARVVAQPAPISPISIQYVAPSTCPDEISLRAGVIARLGQDPFKGDAKRLAMIDVQPTAAGFVAAIELHEPGRAASRRAVGPAVKCEDAIDALELALAVIIDPTSSGAPPPTASTPAPTSPVSYEPPGWRTQPVPEAPRVHELALMIGLIAGVHPESRGYFGIRAGYRFGPRWRIGLAGRLSNDSGAFRNDPTVTYRTYETRISELVIEGCAWHRFVLACAVVGAGSKSVNVDRYEISVGTTEEADYTDPYGLIGANLALEVPLGNAFLRPMIEGAFRLPNVPIESQGVERYELPIAQLAFDLALGYRW